MFFWLCQKCGCNVFANVAPCIIPVFIGISEILDATCSTFSEKQMWGLRKFYITSLNFNGVQFHGNWDTHQFLCMLYKGLPNVRHQKNHPNTVFLHYNVDKYHYPHNEPCQWHSISCIFLKMTVCYLKRFHSARHPNYSVRLS